MAIIHMETERALEIFRQFVRVCNNIYSEMENLKTRAHSMDWQGPGADEFRAEYDALVRQMEYTCNQGILLGQRVDREVSEWFAVDGQGVLSFQELKRAILDLNLIGFGGIGVALAGSNVLGTSTINSMQYLSEYQAMSWKNKIDAEKAIQENIAAHQTRLLGMRTAAEIQDEIGGIDAKIAALEKKRADAISNASIWYNKVIPDFPLEGDTDGAPWRVMADDYEDEVVEYDRQIQELQKPKRGLFEELNTRQQLQISLAELQERQSALGFVIGKGIPVDGPTEPSWLHKQLAGCTNYVAEKRDVSDFGGGHPGNACSWDDQAREAGIDVGELPVKGAIMVFEGQNNVMKVNTTAGHVAYVENVEKINGGYKVTISQANTQYDSQGNFVRGTYENQRE